MTVKEKVLQLPNEEKLMVMEALWESLAVDPENLESPPWHEPVLEATLKRYEEGGEKVFDWEEAKKRLRK